MLSQKKFRCVFQDHLFVSFQLINSDSFLYLICSGEQPNIVWTGYGKKTPVLIFSAQNIVSRKPEIKAIGGMLTYYILPS